MNDQIVALLRKDGRMPFAEIAGQLNISEGTVRNRVSSMKKAGGLRIVAIVDPVEVEYDTDAMLGVKVAPGCSPEVVSNRLADNPEVVFLLWVSGRFDLLVEIVSNDRFEFLQFLQRHIYEQSDIAAVEVMTGLKNFKNQFLLKQNWG